MFRTRTWRLIAKAMGEKASEDDAEADKIAAIRLGIVLLSILTDIIIVIGIIHHW